MDRCVDYKLLMQAGERQKKKPNYDLEQSVLNQTVKNRRFNETFDREYEFQTEFPRVVDYDNMTQVIKHFPFIGQTNSQIAVDYIKQQINQNSNYLVFLLGSSNDDDIHKAIKYRRWTSTENINFMISLRFIHYKLQNYKDPLVFFVFFNNKSESVIGICQMDSPYIPDQTFKYWWHSWFFGNFAVKWIFIADLPYNEISFINEIKVDNSSKSINSKRKLKDNARMLRNGMALKAEYFHKILDYYFKIFQRKNNWIQNYQQKDYECILDYFNFLDQREDKIRYKLDNWDEFQSSFLKHQFINIDRYLIFIINKLSLNQIRVQNIENMLKNYVAKYCILKEQHFQFELLFRIIKDNGYKCNLIQFKENVPNYPLNYWPNQTVGQQSQYQDCNKEYQNQINFRNIVYQLSVDQKYQNKRMVFRDQQMIQQKNQVYQKQMQDILYRLDVEGNSGETGQQSQCKQNGDEGRVIKVDLKYQNDRLDERVYDEGSDGQSQSNCRISSQQSCSQYVDLGQSNSQFDFSYQNSRQGQYSQQIGNQYTSDHQNTYYQGQNRYQKRYVDKDNPWKSNQSYNQKHSHKHKHKHKHKNRYENRHINKKQYYDDDSSRNRNNNNNQEIRTESDSFASLVGQSRQEMYVDSSVYKNNQTINQSCKTEQQKSDKENDEDQMDQLDAYDCFLD